jgi:transposase-like protein
MAMTDLTNPIYNDETAARLHLEAIRWRDGAFCPYCGSVGCKPLGGESMGDGWYHCVDCRKKFTVRVGTIYERSHIALYKWVLATHLMCASKKGISAHQLHRMLGITYKSAWFMAHRIREAMQSNGSQIGGEGKVVEMDETYVGGKAKNRKNHVPPKTAVAALVERNGEVRAQKARKLSTANLNTIVIQHANRRSTLMTDESKSYIGIGDLYAGHETVNHKEQEYARGEWHTNTVEGFFSILKRSVIGTFHHVEEPHLDRYVTEFAFRYNTRKITDDERAVRLIQGVEGKRLTYRRINEQGRARA